MESNPSSKTILITGATSGIGKSAAHLFAHQGWNLILLARREDRLLEIQRELQSAHAIDVKYQVVDVRSEEDVNLSIQRLTSSGVSKIDVLLNNAGLAAGFGPIDEGNTHDWNLMLDTNVKGLLYITKAVLPLMKAQGFGHIINVGSTAGKDVYQNGNVYCASKFAVDALTKSMRIDLLPFGIKVTSINPGACETEFSLVRFQGDEARAKAVYDGFVPLTPEDVASTIYFTTTMPRHVCINDLTLTCLTQANANYNIKKMI